MWLHLCYFGENQKEVYQKHECWLVWVQKHSDQLMLGRVSSWKRTVNKVFGAVRALQRGTSVSTEMTEKVADYWNQMEEEKPRSECARLHKCSLSAPASSIS